MKIIQKLFLTFSRPCSECGGKGYVVDSDVSAFIERNGLAAFQAAETLMVNEIEYGQLGSIPVDTWQKVGLSEQEAEYFATDLGCGRILHSCPECEGQKDHDDALGLATSIIRTMKANDRRRYAEWKASQTPDDRKQRRRRRIAVALQHAQLRRGMDRDEAGTIASEVAAWGVSEVISSVVKGANDV